MNSRPILYAAWQIIQDHTIRLFSGGRMVTILNVLGSLFMATIYLSGWERGLLMLLVMITFFLCNIVRFVALLGLIWYTYSLRDNNQAREIAFHHFLKLYYDDVHKNADKIWLEHFYNTYLNPEEDGKEQ